MKAVLIADEVTASGFALAGVNTFIPQPEQAAHILQEQAEDADLVLISAGMARFIPEDILHPYQIQPKPLVIIIPGVRKQVIPKDKIQEIKKGLGISIGN